MASIFLFFFVLTLAALGAARPSNFNISNEDNGSINRELDLGSIVNDMLMTDEQLEQGSALFAPGSKHIWKNGKVYYVIEPSDFSDTEKNNIALAMEHIQTKTGDCVRFFPRTSQTDYIRIFRGSGCYSYVGKTGGGQDLSLGTGCLGVHIIVHELCHALGFFHEHQRWIRDSYVIIHEENVMDGKMSQFNKIAATEGDTKPYDFLSAMHYESTSFSKDGVSPTMTAVQPGYTWPSLKDKGGMSPTDATATKGRYCCKLLGLEYACSW